jgi:ZIP family zinc transporter
VTLALIIVVVSSALVGGAVWGSFGAVPTTTTGVLFSIAGGALITSLAFELIEPAARTSGNVVALTGLMAGAVVFTAIDHLVDEVWSGGGGLGILSAVTLDGIPENLALGVGLIGAKASDVAALAGAILLSNLPEAAGGAQDLADADWSRARNIGLWASVATILAASTVTGNLALAGLDQTWLSWIRTFAAGAVLASLATEVFPQAFHDARHWSGIAVAIGFVVTFMLSA